MSDTSRGMKAKTIRKVMRKLMENWLASIDDPNIKLLIEKNTIITGGSIASMLLGEGINDFDCYFRNKATTVAVANYYLGRFAPAHQAGIKTNMFVDDSEDRVRIVIKSAGVASEDGTTEPYRYFEGRPAAEAGEYVGDVMDQVTPEEYNYLSGTTELVDDKREEIEGIGFAKDDDKPKFRPVFMSTNAITLSHRVQIILRFFGEPDVVHENFDFVHCTNYWQSWDDKLVLRPAALEALLARELKYVGSKYPVCSVIRLRKFISRGWSINAGQIVKMVMQISALDLTNIRVLQDQLTGVDAAYFVQLISQLKEKDPDKVNTAYLIEIVDRLF